MIFSTRILYPFIVFLFLKSPCTFEEIPRDRIMHGLELGVQEQYDKAIALFENYAKKNIHDPAPHFFLATIWQSKMMDFETSLWRDKFFKEINTTTSLCDSIIRHQPDNNIIRFYGASALAYKSFQISREGKTIKGLRLALRAVEQLNDIVAHDSCFYDAYLGTGSYLYWRSYLTRHFTWLPFFRDQRETGITLIKISFEQGTISRWAALSNLAWIYIQEKRYDKAIQCAQDGLAVFPTSRFFLWPLGDAQFHMGSYKTALDTYSKLLESVTSETFNNRYNETVLHLKIATCLFELGDFKGAGRHAQQVLDIKADEEVQKRLKEKQKNARDLIRELNARDE